MILLTCIRSLNKGRVDEFLIEKYIEISISTKILYADPDRRCLNATTTKE